MGGKPAANNVIKVPDIQKMGEFPVDVFDLDAGQVPLPGAEFKSSADGSAEKIGKTDGKGVLKVKSSGASTSVKMKLNV